MDAMPSPKLPVFSTLLTSWASVPRNLGLAFRLYWPWVAVFAVSGAAWGVGIVANAGFGGTPSQTLIGGAGSLPVIVMLIAAMLAAPTIFSGWQRGIANGERPNQPIQIDGRTWAYIGYSVLIALVLGLVIALCGLVAAIIAGLVTGLGSSPMSLEKFAALRPFLPIAFIPYYLVLSRFTLVLPAIAEGRTMSLADSFRLTRGNTLRLTFGTGLVYFPVVLLSSTMEILGVAFPGNTVLLGIVGLIVILTSFVCLHASLSFATLALKRIAPAPMMDKMEVAA
ncbi:MAG: hypothetical protein JSS20_17125 [Proteobacteria bacterium]|nr:hypothetical protein [Pseudomonadota bacterium]